MGAKIVSDVGNGANIAGYSLSGAETINKFAQGRINTPRALINEAKGYLPFYGTYLNGQKFLRTISYQTTYRPG
jgi:hypothetical protein